MSGCFLKCEWCANPESLEYKQKILFSDSKCKHKEGCVRCKKVCPSDAITFDELNCFSKKIDINRQLCDECTTFECSKACYNEAIRVCGKNYSVNELMNILNRDRQFWGQNGGVTFSGGEPFYQHEFLIAVLKRCKNSYIHTAIETTAFIDTEIFLNAMQYIDFAFIDLKHMNSNKHKEKTGAYNELILKNIEELVKSNWQGRLVIRTPIIKDYNDDYKNIIETADFMRKLGLFEINILPFHRMGDSKWSQLGKIYPYKEYEATNDEKMYELQTLFLDRGIACYVGSDTAF